MKEHSKSPNGYQVLNMEDTNKNYDDSDSESDASLPLHDAVCDPDNLDRIEELLDRVEDVDNDFQTPLHVLVKRGDEATLEISKILLGVTEHPKLVIERPQLLNAVTKDNRTALHYAAQSRQTEVVDAFIRWGANTRVKDINGNTPLHLVAGGDSQNALRVAKSLTNTMKTAHFLSKSEKDTGLVNDRNNNEHTPVHVAVLNKCVHMVELLIDVENNYDFAATDKRGRNILHFCCSVAGESEATCQILESILKSKKCTERVINQDDMDNLTPLHLTAIKRYPKLAKILVDDKRTKVAKTDALKKTALHYAAQEGCYTKGYKCVEALISRKFEKYPDQVQYLFGIEDSCNNTTAFMYACLNCPTNTMQKYTAACPNPKNWLSKTLYMQLIYQLCPMALKPLMDNAFTEVDNEQEDSIKTDFGIITGYEDPVTIGQQESRYLKESQKWDYNSKKEILLHPLTQYFILKKWEKLRFIIFSWICVQLLYLVTFSAVGILYYGNDASHLNGTSHESTESETQGWSVPLAISTVLMLAVLLLILTNEIFEIYTIGRGYFWSITNICQLIQITLGLIAAIPAIFQAENPPDWLKASASFGILIAYILSMRELGKLHPEVGLIIEFLKQVLIQIGKVLISCSPLWIGFTIVFMIIFNDGSLQSNGFLSIIVRVYVMMTGEFDFTDTFSEDDENHSPQNPAFVKSIKLVFFLAFVVAVVIGFFNLLTGFALDKVLELRERANVERAAKQLEHIYFIESLAVAYFRFSKLICCHDAGAEQLRKLNVTSKWLSTEEGQKLKFETSITERIRKDTDGLRLLQRRKNLLNWENQLPNGLCEAIYSLAGPCSCPWCSAPADTNKLIADFIRFQMTNDKTSCCDNESFICHDAKS